MEQCQTIPFDVITNFFKDRMKIGKKKIYEFHLKIAHNHINELLNTRQTLCKSGFIRQIIYKVLTLLNIKFQIDIIGHTKIKWLCRWVASPRRMCFYTPKMMLGWIKRELILKDEVIQSQIDSEARYSTSSYKYTDCNPDLDTVKLLFDNTVEDIVKINIIDTIIDRKWNIFEDCHLHKPIKQIKLL